MSINVMLKVMVSLDSRYLNPYISLCLVFMINEVSQSINVKSEYSLPLRHNDARFTILSHLASWLKYWQNPPDVDSKASEPSLASCRMAENSSQENSSPGSLSSHSFLP